MLVRMGMLVRLGRLVRPGRLVRLGKLEQPGRLVRLGMPGRRCKRVLGTTGKRQRH
ncbi:hypothetical protein FWK35_00008206, partial [Aphis craccivora]